MMRKAISIAVCGASLICFLFIGRLAEYLLSEFVLCRHGYAAQDRPLRDQETRVIPKHLHQIFFELGKASPSKFHRFQLSWQQLNPDYKYTLWNKTSIQNLIHRKYPHLEDLYNGYSHWVQRIDMARYIVLHQYGGWYIDIDVLCKKGIQNLSASAAHSNKSIVTHPAWPFGCTNYFIGVTSQHPFFVHVLNWMSQSNKWYVFPYTTIMFSTGPTFMWGRMLNYPHRKEDVYWVYDQYFDHMGWGSWQNLDGTIVQYFYNHRARLCLLAAGSVITSAMMCVFLCRKIVRLTRMALFSFRCNTRGLL